MPLYERLTRIGMTSTEVRIPVHSFMAAIAELKRGKCVMADLVTAFGLSAGEQTEVTTLLGKIIQRTEFFTLGGYVVLTNIQSAYDGSNAQRGCGFATLDLTGVTSIDLAIEVNKLGSGTQSWQLWNETDASEIGVINDAAGTGNKLLTASYGSLALVGVKRIRMRPKSTVNTDDPIYYGTAGQLHRLNTLTGVELHDILMLAERQLLPPLDTVADVKARLGV